MEIKNFLLIRKKTKVYVTNAKVVYSNFYELLIQNLANFTFTTWDFYFEVSIKRYIKNILVLLIILNILIYFNRKLKVI